MKQYLVNRNHLLLFMAPFVFNTEEQYALPPGTKTLFLTSLNQAIYITHIAIETVSVKLYTNLYAKIH